MNMTREPLSPSAALRLVVARPLVKIKLLFLLASFVSLVLSVSLWFSGSREAAIFVGLWVGAIHSLGALVLVGENPAKGDRRA